MRVQSENVQTGALRECASHLKVLVLSDNIQLDHPFWVELKNIGCDLFSLEEIDFTSFDENIDIFLIEDSTETISRNCINQIVKNHEMVKSFPRILAIPEDDVLLDLKKEFYQCEQVVKVNPGDSFSIEQNAQRVIEIAKQAEAPHEELLHWQMLANQLISEVSQLNVRRHIISQVVGLGPLIREYEYIIKSVLNLLTKAFDIPVASILIFEDDAIYTSVNEPISQRLQLEQHQELLDCINDENQKTRILDVIWGRNLILKEADNNLPEQIEFITLQLRAKDKRLGYWSIPKPNEHSENESFLKILSQLISLLINSALLYKKQHRNVQNNHLRLGAIIEVCRLFADLNVKDFGLQFLLILLEHLGADKAILSLMGEDNSIVERYAIGLDEKTQEWLFSETSSLPWKSTFTQDKQQSGYIVMPTVEESEKSSTMYYIGYPLVDVQGKIGVIFIMFRYRPVDEEEFQPFFQTMATLASTHFANVGLYKQYLEKRLMEEQINIARDIQKELLPTHIPEINDFHLTAKSRPATRVGGDFYDFVSLSPDKHAIVIGDVSGKGIPASMLMSMTKSLLKFRLQQGSDLSSALFDVNNYLASETPAEKFVTAMAITIDENRKCIEVVNAGHGALLIYRTSEKIFEEIDADGLALSIMQDVTFESKQTTYSRGDIFLMFTDGLGEAMSPTRELFGINRVKEILQRMSDSDVQDIIKEFYDAITRHAAGKPQHDDTTVVILKAK